MVDQLYGDHENQVLVRGEADLLNDFNSCKKNPDHVKFIPVKNFTLNDLPEGHRDNDFYELIKCTADLTVRVAVKKISQNRPEFWPNTKFVYPFYEIRGETILRLGSGRVSKVEKFTDGYYRDLAGVEHRSNYNICSCNKCQHSDTPSHVWWEFNTYTAAHVVFDNIEASHTSLRFFYDREDSPVVSVDKVRVDHVYIERDLCVLKCMTCDKDLGDKLYQSYKRYSVVCVTVRDKYRQSRDVDKLNFIVSHPHGCYKQISIGHWVDRRKVGDRLSQFTYTTCTCPGSSGARVYCMGYGGAWLYQPVHTGTLNSKLNYSGTGEVY